MAPDVVFAPEARDNILDIYSYIAARGGPTRAQNFVERIIAHCESFATFPNRGVRRDDLRPGLRIIGYRRRVTIAFHIEPDRVTIDRILYGGRDLPRAFGQR